MLYQWQKLDPQDIDLIILSTTTPDKIFPATATMLQDRLGASCPAFDLQAVCAGFVFALSTAQQYIENGSAKNILVVGSETMSKLLTGRSLYCYFICRWCWRCCSIS